MKPDRIAFYRSAMTGIEAMAADTVRAFPRHSHEVFGVGLIDRGAQRSLSDRGSVDAGPGDIIMVNPGEVHDGKPLGHTARAWRMLYFDPKIVTDMTSDISLGAARQIEITQPAIYDPILSQLFNRLFSAVIDGADVLYRDEACLTVIAHVVQRHAELKYPKILPAPIARAQALLDDDPSVPHTLAELAAEAGMSRFQILRGFAHELGLTPHAYQVQRRVALARRLILAKTPLADAAAISGFADQSHMTRAFVQRFGVTPGAYARTVAGAVV